MTTDERAGVLALVAVTALAFGVGIVLGIVLGLRAIDTQPRDTLAEGRAVARSLYDGEAIGV